MADDFDRTEGSRSGIDPKVSGFVLLGGLVLLAGGVLAYFALRPEPSPPPPAIADDPLLVEGRELYLWRCVSCHGESGQGDGPISQTLQGPSPGDLTDDDWKYGDRPEQVLTVLANGIEGTSMAGWKGTFRPDQLRAVAAYVYYLSGRPIPDALRETDNRVGPGRRL